MFFSQSATTLLVALLTLAVAMLDFTASSLALHHIPSSPSRKNKPSSAAFDGSAAALTTSTMMARQLNRGAPPEQSVAAGTAVSVSPRRAFVTAILLGSAPCLLLKQDAASALQPRNEVLCGTGLFEHFLEYRCTPIGDIEDEGISKGLSDAEETAAESLLSKLFVGDTTTMLPSSVVKDEKRAQSSSAPNGSDISSRRDE